MWNLPRPGIEPVSPALAVGFLSTVPPGKSHSDFFVHPFSLHSKCSFWDHFPSSWVISLRISLNRELLVVNSLICYLKFIKHFLFNLILKRYFCWEQKSRMAISPTPFFDTLKYYTTVFCITVAVVKSAVSLIILPFRWFVFSLWVLLRSSLFLGFLFFQNSNSRSVFLFI